MGVGGGSNRSSTDGFRSLGSCILTQWHALTPNIQGGSRMRRRARTVLCGGYRVIGIPTATGRWRRLRNLWTFWLTAARAGLAGNGQYWRLLRSRGFAAMSRLAPALALQAPF